MMMHDRIIGGLITATLLTLFERFKVAPRSVGPRSSAQRPLPAGLTDIRNPMWSEAFHTHASHNPTLRLGYPSRSSYAQDDQG
jgi:hypothetical protein